MYSASLLIRDPNENEPDGITLLRTNDPASRFGSDDFGDRRMGIGGTGVGLW